MPESTPMLLALAAVVVVAVTTPALWFCVPIVAVLVIAWFIV